MSRTFPRSPLQEAPGTVWYPRERSEAQWGYTYNSGTEAPMPTPPHFGHFRRRVHQARLEGKLGQNGAEIEIDHRGHRDLPDGQIGVLEAVSRQDTDHLCAFGHPRLDEHGHRSGRPTGHHSLISPSTTTACSSGIPCKTASSFFTW